MRIREGKTIKEMLRRPKKGNSEAQRERRETPDRKNTIVIIIMIMRDDYEKKGTEHEKREEGR